MAGNLRADERQDLRDAVKSARTLAKACDFPDLTGKAVSTRNRTFALRYRDPGQDQDSPDNVFLLFQLLCTEGKANDTDIFLTRDTDGYRLLTFAEPKLDYDYTDESFSKLKAPPSISGYTTSNRLSNAEFDAKTNTITMHANWRQLGDAWSAGTWTLIDGEFVLKSFTVDPTYNPAPDGEAVVSGSYQIFPEIKAQQ
jgi:hypothetical protein